MCLAIDETLGQIQSQISLNSCLPGIHSRERDCPTEEWRADRTVWDCVSRCKWLEGGGLWRR